jgi:hypothetical protein
MVIPGVDLTTPSPRAIDSSPELLRDLLEQWEARLREVHFPVDDAVRPGLDPNHVADTLVARGLEVPSELVVWFGWHDGQPCESHRLTPAFSPMAMLTTSLDRRDAQGPYFGSDFGSWEPAWLPLSNERASLAIDTEGGQVPRVRMVDFGEFGTWGPSSHTQVESLCTAVTWFLSALVSGAHRWNPSTLTWHRDQESLDPIARIMGYA